MKFLIRRIRYMFAGHIIRTVMALFSAIVLFVVVFFFMSGAVNQRELVTKIFGFIWNSSSNLSEQIEDGDVPVEINKDGVYIKPPGSESSESDSSTEADSEADEVNGPEEYSESESESGNVDGSN